MKWNYLILTLSISLFSCVFSHWFTAGILMAQAEIEGSLTATGNIKTMQNLVIENNDPHLYFKDENSGSLPIRIWADSDGDVNYFESVGGDLEFRFAPTGGVFFPQLYIEETGNIGIGTRFPDARLEIDDNAEMLRLTYDNHGFISFWDGLFNRDGYIGYENSTTTNLTIRNENSGNIRLRAGNSFFQVDPSGKLFGNIRFIGDKKNMQYNSSTGEIGYDNSSRRYKRKISTLTDDWTKILKVRPVTYTRPSNLDHWEFGYVAEEIDSLGLTNLVGYDAEGLPDDVKYDRMVLYIIEMLKIYQQEVSALKREVNRLEFMLSENSSK